AALSSASSVEERRSSTRVSAIVAIRTYSFASNQPITSLPSGRPRARRRLRAWCAPRNAVPGEREHELARPARPSTPRSLDVFVALVRRLRPARRLDVFIAGARGLDVLTRRPGRLDVLAAGPRSLDVFGL